MVGVVGRGQGLASGWMREDLRLWEVLDPGLHLATINIYVSGNHPGFEQDFRPNQVRAAGQLRTIPCRVDGHRAFILRIECPGPHIPIPQPNTMLEIVTTKLQVCEGSEVQIDFDTSQVMAYTLP